MKFNLEALRAVVRPYASQAVGMPELLEKLWPMIVDADEDSKELAESIQDLIALQAARSIDEVAFRQRLIRMAFPPATVGQIVSIEIHTQAVEARSGGIMHPAPGMSAAQVVELIPA